MCGAGNLDMVCSLGADRVIDYAKECVAEEAEAYDLILRSAARCRSRVLSCAASVRDLRHGRGSPFPI